MTTLRLGTVCVKIGSGATPRGGSDVYLPEGVALIRSQNVYNDGLRLDGLAFINDEHAAQLSGVEVKVDDVLLNITGDSVARACLAPPEILPARVNQHVAIIRPDTKLLDPRYLHYHLISPLKQAEMLAIAGGGATRNALTKGMIEEFEVPAPSITEQRTIANVLGSLDAKIKQNRRTSQVLERLARAIFRAWFVNFEPVKAKASGSQSFPPMTQATFNSLPNALVKSSLGSIPDAWNICSLDQILDVNPAYRLTKGTIAPYLDMGQMPTNGHTPDGWVMREVGSGAKFTNGDTLVARITPCLENGKTAYVDFLSPDEIAWGSTEYIVLRPKAPIPGIYAYLLARSSEFRAFAIQNMTGTSGRQRVPYNALSKYQIAVPPSEIFTAFKDIVNPLIKRSSAAADESRTLMALRDALLPKLMSGELRATSEGER